MARRQARLARARHVALALGYDIQVEDLGWGLEQLVLVDLCCRKRWAFDHVRQLERFLRTVDHWLRRLANVGAPAACRSGACIAGV